MERIEATDPAIALKYAKPRCKLCFGSGIVAQFLHGKKGKYKHERACWCAVTNWADAVMAPKPAGERASQGPTAGEGATLSTESKGA